MDISRLNFSIIYWLSLQVLGHTRPLLPNTARQHLPDTALQNSGPTQLLCSIILPPTPARPEYKFRQWIIRLDIFVELFFFDFCFFYIWCLDFLFFFFDFMFYDSMIILYRLCFLFFSFTWIFHLIYIQFIA